MKKRSFLSFPLLCFFLSAALPAIAQQTLYENGPIDGNQDAFTINFGFLVSDSFTISSGKQCGEWGLFWSVAGTRGYAGIGRSYPIVPVIGRRDGILRR